MRVQFLVPVLIQILHSCLTGRQVIQINNTLLNLAVTAAPLQMCIVIPVSDKPKTKTYFGS
jgi:hypothetical protein